MATQDDLTAERADCTWTYDDYSDYYETACGEAYCLADGTLDENRHRFCVYCGGKIRAIMPLTDRLASEGG